MQLDKHLQEKWAPVLDADGVNPIKDQYKRAVTAVLLENQERAFQEQASLLNETTNISGNLGGPNASSGNVQGYDPILINLVRRSLPNLMAYDIAGVQPMSGPTGLIFAMKSQYANSTDASVAETFFNEVNSAFSGAGSQISPIDFANTATMTSGTGIATETAEASSAFPEMGFTIEKVAVEAKTRQLKAEYTIELAQDLKAVHGLDAEQELSSILANEILAEINRETLRTVYRVAEFGAQGTTADGTFDLTADADGRWAAERFKGLHFQIEKDANAISKRTRRGKGNILICSADVASALAMAGVLDHAPALQASLVSDENASTFAGTIGGGRMKVFIDPYMNTGTDFYCLGYKGTSAFDAGIFYCPYVPLQMVRAFNENSFQPKVGFKTRYGMVGNPFSAGSAAVTSALTADSNVYYRKAKVTNIL